MLDRARALSALLCRTRDLGHFAGLRGRQLFSLLLMDKSPGAPRGRLGLVLPVDQLWQVAANACENAPRAGWNRSRRLNISRTSPGFSWCRSSALAQASTGCGPFAD
jgi:hypothetical protein